MSKLFRHMKKAATVLFVSVSSILLTACSATLPISYTPSNLTSGSGTVSVSRFSYTAAINGKVAPNQPEKHPSGIGAVYLSEEIETLITDAVRKEFRFSGYELADSASTSVSGSIDRFYYDWVGLSAQRVELVITFTLDKDGRRMFSRTVAANKEAPKAPGYETEAMKYAISECIKRFLHEAKSEGAI